ncbi:uracil-DNA glycosylase [Gorillibacterium sp. sgz5001074]|uniref:uracil-DNA glycosylase n=1 Tax=Gorillibacterium sp. sgz5001074 TaxID=3446695 RepID=UPI003F662895
MEPFVPSVWPEALVPAAAEGCVRCALAAQRKRIIWGEGNPEAPVYILLDNPGARETPEGEAFVCGTRQTLQQAAHETGFRQSDLFVTYLLKCRPVRAYDKETARASCLPYLEDQLAARKPKLLFCMGNVALRAYCGDTEAEVKGLRGKLHEIGSQTVAVTYHPLAVRRRPNLYPLFLQDWQLVKLFLE